MRIIRHTNRGGHAGGPWAACWLYGSYEQATRSLGTATASTIDLAPDLLLYISQREKKSKKPKKYMFTVRNSTMTVKLIQGVNLMIKNLTMIPGGAIYDFTAAVCTFPYCIYSFYHRP